MAWRTLITAGLVGIALSGSVHADWHTFWHGVHVDYQRNNVWPHPFREMAAAQTRAPFEVMTYKGWQRHNTISQELFREGDGALTSGGRVRLQGIATQSPPQYRFVLVPRAPSAEETEARIASVRSALERIYMAGPVPQVYMTDVDPGSTPGDMATQINRAWLQSLPAPKLPEPPQNPGG
jgi:hypothetical protein